MRRGYSLRKITGNWYVTWSEYETAEDGTSKRKQRSHRLASCADYPKKSEVWPLAEGYMATVNRTRTAEAANTVAKFFDDTYLPDARRRLVKSSVSNYCGPWRNYLKAHLGNERLRDVQTHHLQKALDAIYKKEGDRLGHGMYIAMVVTLSAIFAHAKRQGHVTHNAAQGLCVTNYGHELHRENGAYFLQEVKQFLTILQGQLAAVVACFALTALRNNELPALDVADYTGTHLRVHRAWSHGILKETKTGNDELVPVIAPLRKLLDAIKPASGFLFQSPDGGPIKLQDVEDEIRAKLVGTGLKWKGLYAFRRGLCSNLWALGVREEVAALILRNSVEVVRKHYLKFDAERLKLEAMQKLEAAWNADCDVSVKQPANGQPDGTRVNTAFPAVSPTNSTRLN